MSLEPLTPKGNAFFSDFKLNGARWAAYLSLEFAAYLYLNTRSGEALLDNLSARYIPYPRPLLLFASALSLLAFETTVLRAALSLAEQPGKAPPPPPQEKPKPKPVQRSIPRNNNLAKESEALLEIYSAIFGCKPDEKATDEELVEAILNGITSLKKTHRDHLAAIYEAVSPEGGVLPNTEYELILNNITSSIKVIKEVKYNKELKEV